MSGSPIQISNVATQLEHIGQDAWISTTGLMLEYDPEAISTVGLMLEYVPPIYREADIVTSSSLVSVGNITTPPTYAESNIVTSSSLVAIGSIDGLPKLTNISTMYEYQFPATGLTNISVMYEYTSAISGEAHIITSSSMVVSAENYTEHHVEVDIITTSSFVSAVKNSINAYADIITESTFNSIPGGTTYARASILTESEMITIGNEIKGGNPWYYYAQL